MTPLSPFDTDKGGKGWAIGFATALPMNRAVFHRLGLSVGIAIALAGCDTTGEYTEAETWQYARAASMIEYQQPGMVAAKRGLADGFLSTQEWEAINAEDRADIDARLEDQKRAAIIKYGSAR